MKRITILLALATIACSPGKVNKAELVEYIQNADNGLIKKISQGEIDLEMIYRPSALVVEQQIAGEQYSEAQIDSIRINFDQYDYFVLKISSSGEEISNRYAGDDLAFAKAIEHLSFGIGKDLRMQVGDKKIYVRDFIHARSFGSGNANTLLLAFESNLKQRDEDFTIEFEDSFFKTGTSRFNFRIADLKALPSLNLISSSL
jgi:hypothetical protein